MNKTKQANTLRADASKALYDILESGKSARECLPFHQQGYSDKDKAWLQEMVYGVLRNLPILQSWLRKLLDKPLKDRMKVIEMLIMLGFYQLAFTRVSTHAAVAETVNAAKLLKADSLKGLINAVLRNFIRQELAQQPVDNPQVASGLPKWLYKRIVAAYPQHLDQIIQATSEKAPIWLRVNQQKISRDEYAQCLSEAGVEFTIPLHHEDGIILQKSCDVTLLPGFEQGHFAVQDGAAQLAAPYLDAQAGESILDCCAAPGGKTCHILERQPNLQNCVALDVDANRLERIQENLHRLSLNAELICADASDPDSWWTEQLFDRILLDAPCSATGVIRRHPDIKWLRKGKDIEVLTALQYQLLETNWQLLKSGGTLLYATCSILPDENQQQIVKFLESHPDATLHPLTSDEKANWPGQQILPGEQQMDGFYYARLLKS